MIRILISIRIAGAGGHGIVFAARVLGNALTKRGFNVAMRVAYSPAQRGGWSRADIVVSSEETIWNPIADELDVLIVTTQERYDAEIKDVRRGGYVIYEPEVVKPRDIEGVKHIPIEAFKLSEAVTGSRIFGNSVLIGFFASASGLISLSLLEEVMRELGVRALDNNLKALRIGFERGFNVKINLKI